MASPSGRRVPQEIPGWHKLSPAEIRRLPPKPSGARYSGKERLYENLHSGAIIPRRQYVDKQAQALGWKSWADYQYASRIAGGLGGMRSEAGTAVNWTLQLAERRQGDTGVPDIRTREQRRQFMRIHAAELRALRADPENMVAHGPLATWMEALGIREQNAPYAVGDTPRAGRQRRA